MNSVKVVLWDWEWGFRRFFTPRIRHEGESFVRIRQDNVIALLLGKGVYPWYVEQMKQ